MKIEYFFLREMLPPEIICFILDKVDTEFLGVCAAVSKKWHKFVLRVMHSRREPSILRPLLVLDRVSDRTKDSEFSILQANCMKIDKWPFETLEKIRSKGMNIIGPVSGDDGSSLVVTFRKGAYFLNTQVYIGTKSEPVKYRCVTIGNVQMETPEVSWVNIGFFVTGIGIIKYVSAEETIVCDHILSSDTISFAPIYVLKSITPLTRTLCIADVTYRGRAKIAFLTPFMNKMGACISDNYSSFKIEDDVLFLTKRNKHKADRDDRDSRPAEFVSIPLKKLLAPITLHSENRIVFIE